MKQGVAGFFQRVYVMWQMFWMEREVKKNLSTARTTFLMKYLATDKLETVMEMPDPSLFPNIEKRRQGYESAIEAYAKEHPNVPADVMMGDSLAEFLQGTSSPIDINLGLAGGSSTTMEYIARRLIECFKRNNVVVRSITMGCFFGNAVLYHQNYEAARRDATKCLHTLRELFPKAYFVIYGMPPVYDLYAAAFQFDAREFFLSWIASDKHDANGDGGSCYLDICRAMGGFLGIMPKAAMSLESIHMTPKGKEVFVKMIVVGIRSLPGTYIFKV